MRRDCRLVRVIATKAAFSGLCLAVSAPSTLPGVPTGSVEILCVDDQACGYATFQSHNQKLVFNRYGIFMTYLREDNEKDGSRPNVWRLMRSTDGGGSFSVLYEGRSNCRAPCLETDETGDLYLAHPEYGSPAAPENEFHLYRFSAASGYRQPRISVFSDVPCAAKYAMAYDPTRRQLYIATQYGRLLIADENGKLLHNRECLEFAGPNASTQYPHLFVDSAGTLHHAWTTVKRGAELYWDIHHMLSPDGGETWENLDGRALRPPMVPDDTGPTLRITLDDEFEHNTWLSSFLVNEGSVHFLYLTRTNPSRQHYVRYDLGTHRRDIDLQPQFRGETIALSGIDGFFATSSTPSGTALYCVMQDQGHIACLMSEDNGTTWHDRAKSKDTFSPYSIGGYREVTADGHILGSFTDHSRVYFFRIHVRESDDPDHQPEDAEDTLGRP